MIGDLLWENSILFERLQRKLTETNFRNEERRRLVRKLVARVNRSVLNHRRSLPSCIVPTAGGQHSIVLPSGASRVLLAPPERPKDIYAMTDGGKNKEPKENLALPRGRKKGNSDKRFVQPIPLDSMGRPIFPIELPGIEVHCLGEIDNKRPGYHTEDLLFPIGFCSSREFAAVTDPLHSCTLYTCTVNDNGPEPKFEVSGDDNPAVVYSGRTPDEAVSALVSALNVALAKTQTLPGLPVLPPGKGAQFFGLSIPTIHHLIQ
ncbi:transforming growth factor beta regulator 1-like, partial [Tropilaelaps mercedesae]